MKLIVPSDTVPKYLILVLVASLAAGLEASPYSQGKAHYSRGNYNKARESFQKSTKTNPGNGNAFFYLASMLDREGKKGQAIGYYRKAVAGSMDPELREKAYWKLVLYYRYHRDWDNLAAYSSRFLSFRKIGKVQGFLAEAERNRDPTRASIARHMREAQAKQEAGDSRGAADHYRRALALRNYDPARWELAILLMKQKQYPEASRHLKRLVASDDARWSYHYKLGVCNYHLGAHTAALRNFKQARELNQKPGKDFRFFVGLGEGLALLETGEYAKARESLRGSAASRKSATALSALARSEFWLGRPDQAERYARQALAVKAEEPEAYLALGLSQNSRGQKRQALSSLKRMHEILSADKKKPAGYFSPGYLILGTLASLSKEHELSLSALNRVNRDYLRTRNLARLSGQKESFQPDPVYDFYYGKGLLETGRSRESLNYFKRIKPTPSVSYMTARAHGSQNDARGARRELKRAFAGKPELRVKALSEPVFRRLAERDVDFLLFLEDREPAPAPGGPGSPASRPSGQPARPNTKPPEPLPAPVPGAPKMPALDLEG